MVTRLAALAAGAVVFCAALPASAGVGGVRYLAITGSVTSNTVTWNLVNYWNRPANTTSALGPVTVGMLRTRTTVTQPITPGTCTTITLTGAWSDGVPVTGHLTATACN